MREFPQGCVLFEKNRFLIVLIDQLFQPHINLMKMVETYGKRLLSFSRFFSLVKCDTRYWRSLVMTIPSATPLLIKNGWRSVATIVVADEKNCPLF